MIRNRRPIALLTLVALLLALLLDGTAGASRVGLSSVRAASVTPRRVLLVSVPRLTWNEILQDRPRNILALLGRSAVASMSDRTIGSRTSLGEGYATLGAGNRTGVADANAGNAFGPHERFEDGSAGATYARRTGLASSDNVLQVDIASVLSTNKGLLYGAKPGLLGTTLQAHGWRRAVIGNGDFGVEGVPTIADVNSSDNSGGQTGASSNGNSGDNTDPGAADPSATNPNEPIPTSFNRPSALAMMDEQGRVPEGDVSRDLLVRDPKSPFGLRTSRAAYLRTFRRVWRDKSAVLVELSDLERADRYSRAATPHQARVLQRQTLKQVDQLLGGVLASVDVTRDLVVLVSPAAPRAGEQTTPFAISGPGIRSGVTQSGTTRRSGYVTLPDVAPTILHQLRIDQPTEMTGALIAESGRGSTGLARYRTFATRNTVTSFRDLVAGPISVWFVVFELLGLAFAMLSLTGRRQGLRPWAMFVALVTLAFPTVTFLAGLFRVDHLGYGGFTVSLFAVSVVLALLAQQVGFRLMRRDDPRSAMVPPLLLVGLLWILQVADILTGGRLQIDTVFGYSPVVAGRFAGYGNLAFALLAISTVVLSTGLWGLARIQEATGHTSRPRVGLALVAAIFLVAIVADGYPAFGSDVGGVLALVPAGAVILLMLSGRKVNVARVAIIGSVSVAVLGVFAAIDLARPAQDRTHLGRLVASAAGGGGLGTVLDRKLSANLHVLTSSVFIWVIPSALLFLAFLTWRRRGFIRNLMEFVPGIRACLWGSIIVAVLGFALNDSGMAIPAMMFPVLLPYLMHMLVQPDSGPDAQAPQWLEAMLSRLERDDATVVREADGWKHVDPTDSRPTAAAPADPPDPADPVPSSAGAVVAPGASRGAPTTDARQAATSGSAPPGVPPA
ncbi:MAG: hypothetical protein M3Z46_10695 [Actinomycetota bacterium]|nr:hypothetical protein [Actinomycetota bacterium]